MYVNKGSADFVTNPTRIEDPKMLKKIATAVALAGALAFSAAAPAVLSAGSHGESTGTSVAVGNWPDPMTTPSKGKSAEVERGKSAEQVSYITYVGNWPDPM
jgi:uncharacterized low-complexity protein